jgi:hypothetical protein
MGTSSAQTGCVTKFNDFTLELRAVNLCESEFVMLPGFPHVSREGYTRSSDQNGNMSSRLRHARPICKRFQALPLRYKRNQAASAQGIYRLVAVNHPPIAISCFPSRWYGMTNYLLKYLSTYPKIPTSFCTTKTALKTRLLARKRTQTSRSIN